MNSTAIKDALTDVSIGSITLYSLFSVVLVFLLCFVAIKIILRVLRRVLDRSRMEQGVKGFINSGAKCLLWIIAIIIVAGELGINTTSLVALLSVAGLALSLSIQGVMTNLFSGITILTTKPFISGDYVELDGMSGKVKDIGLFYTTVTTIDNKIVYIPNGQVAAGKIVNYTQLDKRRVDLSFTASYDAETENVKNALLDAAKGDRRVLNDPAPPFAGLLSYGDSAIEYALRVWVKEEDYWDVYFALNECVREAFAKNNIEMTYNHLNVHLDK